MRIRFALLALFFAAATLEANFTVINTNDSGPGSLRDAISQANANPGPDTIDFNIPSSDPGCAASGVCTITPLTPLDTITEAVTIDGYTQPGSSMNTDPVATNA